MAKTFKQIYDGLDPHPPKTMWVKRIAEVTKKSEITVRMWLCGRQTPDSLAQDVISKELGVPPEELFPAGNK